MKSSTLVFSRRNHAIFDAIQQGIKTIETRAGTSRFKTIRPGDTLIFKCGAEQFERQVKAVKHYKSITEMAEEIDVQLVLPGVQSLKEAEAVYYKFPGYKEKIYHYGLLAFILK